MKNMLFHNSYLRFTSSSFQPKFEHKQHWLGNVKNWKKFQSIIIFVECVDCSSISTALLRHSRLDRRQRREGPPEVELHVQLRGPDDGLHLRFERYPIPDGDDATTDRRRPISIVQRSDVRACKNCDARKKRQRRVTQRSMRAGATQSIHLWKSVQWKWCWISVRSVDVKM